MRILLADDEPLVRSGVANVLRHLGHKVLEAGDGPEAVEMFRAEPEQIDVVILDQIMPNMTGRTALDAIRAIRPEAPAVLCSGFPDSEQEAKPAVETNTRFIQKPYSISELRNTLEELVGPAGPTNP